MTKDNGSKLIFKFMEEDNLLTNQMMDNILPYLGMDKVFNFNKSELIDFLLKFCILPEYRFFDNFNKTLMHTKKTLAWYRCNYQIFLSRNNRV